MTSDGEVPALQRALKEKPKCKLHSNVRELKKKAFFPPDGCSVTEFRRAFCRIKLGGMVSLYHFEKGKHIAFLSPTCTLGRIVQLLVEG